MVHVEVKSIPLATGSNEAITRAMLSLKAACNRHQSPNWRQSCSWMHRKHRIHTPGSGQSKAHLIVYGRETHPLQLIGLRHPLSRNHVEPLLPPLLGMDIENLCRNESRRNAVDPAEVNPLNRQALGQLNDTGLGSIVLDGISNLCRISHQKECNSRLPASGAHSPKSR